MNEFYQALTEIENDNISGSVALADKLIALIIRSNLSASERTPALKRIEQLSKSKPFFATLAHLTETLKNTPGDWPKALTAYKRKYDLVAHTIASKLTLSFSEINSVLLHSRSMTILNAFERLTGYDTKLKIFQTQSLPAKEGIIQAAELHDLGFSVEIVQDNPDRSVLEKVDLFITGADLILPEQIINKSGTKRIAEKMKELGKPYYVLSDSRKSSQKFAAELPPEFESVPRSLITQIITE